MLGGGNPDDRHSKLEYESIPEVDLGPLELDRAPIEELPAKRVEKTRSLLAYLLLALIAAIIGVLLGFLGAGIINTDQLGSAAAVLLAPMFGLLGAATGYYYGRGDR